MFEKFRKACKAFKNEISGSTINADTNWWNILTIDKKTDKPMNEVVYYTCLRILAETIAKMPLKLYREDSDKGNIKAFNNAFKILRTRPNEFLTPSTFWSAVVMNIKHYGNAYVWVRRELTRLKYGGEEKTVDFWILPANKVDLIIDNSNSLFCGKGELYYRYSDIDGQMYVFPQRDILHFKNSHSFDGIMGKSVLSDLNDLIMGNLKSQTFMADLYKSGLTSKMALNYTADLNDKQITLLKEKYESYMQGVKGAKSVIPVPLGCTLQPLNIKLTDAQFFELKKYTALQIAAAFGLKPNQINDYEKSSFASAEAQQLAFLVDTVLFDIKSIEEELNYKLLSEKERIEGYFFKFNEKVILRVDSSTQAEILAKYVNNGIYTPNEARYVIDLPYCEGGDKLIVNGNYIPITDVGQQYYNSGGKGNEQ